jgi:hypothetical protein
MHNLITIFFTLSIMSHFTRKTVLTLALCSLLFALSSCGKTPEAIKGEEAEKQIEENLKLIEQVGRLMVVPNEEPIVATINEAELLRKEQPFYAAVSNGDKLIIFPKNQKAVIYSPTKNIIINSGPFTINDTPAAGTAE